jgi:hypothetical protein
MAGAAAQCLCFYHALASFRSSEKPFLCVCTYVAMGTWCMCMSRAHLHDCMTGTFANDGHCSPHGSWAALLAVLLAARSSQRAFCTRAVVCSLRARSCDEDRMSLRHEDRMSLRHEDRMSLRHEDRMSLRHEDRMSLRHVTDICMLACMHTRSFIWAPHTSVVGPPARAAEHLRHPSLVG